MVSINLAASLKCSDSLTATREKSEEGAFLLRTSFTPHNPNQEVKESVTKLGHEL